MEHSDIVTKLQKDFDQTFKSINKDGISEPFSVEELLSDLINNGLSIFEAIDILYEIREHLYEDISSLKLTQLLSQAAQSNSNLVGNISDNLLQPVNIRLKDGSLVQLSIPQLQPILNRKLQGYTFTASTSQLIIQELYRLIISLRISTVQEDTISQMIPTVLKNTISLDPFSAGKLDDDYRVVKKLSKSLKKTWTFLPETEKTQLLLSYFESVYRIFLVSFDFLPGPTFNSILRGLKSILSDFHLRSQEIITERHLFLLKKTSREISSLIELHPRIEEMTWFDSEWIEALDKLTSMTELLVNRGSIKWLILIDNAGNELYAKFTSQNTSKHRALLGMAISGVQNLMSELTHNEIQQIDQDEGSILIEKRELFSIISLIDLPTPYIQRRLQKLAQFVETDLLEFIREFKGEVDKFYTVLNEYISQNIQGIFR